MFTLQQVSHSCVSYLADVSDMVGSSLEAYFMLPTAAVNLSKGHVTVCKSDPSRAFNLVVRGELKCVKAV